MTCSDPVKWSEAHFIKLLWKYDNIELQGGSVLQYAPLRLNYNGGEDSRISQIFT